MPLIVDKDAVRLEILTAFEACIEDKPMDRISLRDIAARAHMTHPKLLHYFQNKEELILAYCDYAKNYMTQHCIDWFSSHHAEDFSSPLDCLNAFMQYVADGGREENRPNATMQTYVLARYNGDLQKMVTAEFDTWRATMLDCLRQLYKNQVGPAQAEAMMILITGTFVCNHTHALTGEINPAILSALRPLFPESSDNI